MGANIHYRRTSKVDPSLEHIMAPSSFIESLERAFGFPCELGEAAIPVLRGMSVMHADRRHNPYEEVIELIERLGSIELYASY